MEGIRPPRFHAVSGPTSPKSPAQGSLHLFQSFCATLSRISYQLTLILSLNSLDYASSINQYTSTSGISQLEPINDIQRLFAVHSWLIPISLCIVGRSNARFFDFSSNLFALAQAHLWANDVTVDVGTGSTSARHVHGLNSLPLPVHAISQFRPRFTLV